MLLKKHLPEWKLLDELLVDSEAMQQLVQILKLQDQWLKHRASSLYIDPLLLELKIRLLSRDELADSFVKCWHPVAQIDQLSPKGLEKAFAYWRDLLPIAERFKDQFRTYGAQPGEIGYDELVELNIFTKEQFENRLDSLHKELLERSSQDGEIEYKTFIHSEKFEDKAIRAYLVAFLVTEGRATMKIDPLSERIALIPLLDKSTEETKSVAIGVG